MMKVVLYLGDGTQPEGCGKSCLDPLLSAAVHAANYGAQASKEKAGRLNPRFKWTHLVPPWGFPKRSLSSIWLLEQFIYSFYRSDWLETLLLGARS